MKVLVYQIRELASRGQGHKNLAETPKKSRVCATDLNNNRSFDRHSNLAAL